MLADFFMSFNKQIIVTGGAGYIGSHTCVELIKAGYEPVIIDDFRNSRTWIIDRISEISGFKPAVHQIDCTNDKAVDQVFKQYSNISGVIHFAAYKAVGESVNKPLMYFENNLGSLMAILAAMDNNKVEHLVFSSSCTVYGEPDSAMVTENTPIQTAASPYGQSKIISEQIIASYFSTKKPIKATLLRYFNPIGAHPSAKIGELPQGVPNNLVPYLTQTVKGIREKLTVFGNDYQTPDGTCIRDYIHVVDLADAHIKALQWSEKQEEDFCEAFNLGTGKGSSVLEIIDTFEKANNIKVNFEIGPRRSGDVEQIYAQPNKANKLLGWTCKYSLSDALKHSWDWEKSINE